MAVWKDAPRPRGRGSDRLRRFRALSLHCRTHRARPKVRSAVGDPLIARDRRLSRLIRTTRRHAVPCTHVPTGRLTYTEN
jgi:hypothetical protein